MEQIFRNMGNQGILLQVSLVGLEPSTSYTTRLTRSWYPVVEIIKADQSQSFRYNNKLLEFYYNKKLKYFYLNIMCVNCMSHILLLIIHILANIGVISCSICPNCLSCWTFLCLHQFYFLSRKVRGNANHLEKGEL